MQFSPVEIIYIWQNMSR